MIQQFFEGLRDRSYPVFFLYEADSGQTRAISSQQLWSECRRWQAFLRQRPEPVVAVFGHATLPMIAAWLGAMLAGKRPVFLSYPSHKIQASDYERKMANYVARFGACVFVGEHLDRAVCGSLFAPEDLSESLPEEAMPLPDWAVGESPLFVQCGSGTTGMQKAVVVGVGHLTRQIELYGHSLSLNPAKDRVISWLPLYHDMGLVAAFLLPLLTRTPFVLIDTFEWAANPELLLRLIDQQQATLCWLPNFAFALLGKNRSMHKLDSMRAFINCSEPVSLAAMQRFLQAHAVHAAQLAVCYALAENVFAVSQTPLGTPPRLLRVDRIALQRREVRVCGTGYLGENIEEGSAETVLLSCGPVLPGVELRLEIQGQQQVGEIEIAGPCAVPCFSPDPADSALSKPDDWTATGDRGFLHDGQLYICGRSKDLIIHNGKNLYPQDLEEVVSQHPEVYPGRVCALGLRDDTTGSENVLIVFEPRQYLPIERRAGLCAVIAQSVDLLFDTHPQVVSVPRRWLQKTSSGKMARWAVLDRYLSSQNKHIHLCGDSHVRIFWTNDTSHQNVYQYVKAYWLGVLWADNWQQAVPFFVDLVARIDAKDALIIQAGEPECRTIFPQAADPMARIEQSVNGYREFFLLLRKIWPGRLAYMTGIPTQPINRNNGDAQWPIFGDPESRYRYQALFYQRMRQLCIELMIHFIDVCTPLLEADGWMDPQRLVDHTHLTRQHQNLYWEQFETIFGFLSDALEPDEGGQGGSWDGSYDHYRVLVEKKVRTLAMGQEPDWEHLISAGTLDSLAIIELIRMLNQVCHFAIQPNVIVRGDFESIEGIYRRFAPKTKPE